MYEHHPHTERIETSLKALSRELRWHRRAWLLLAVAAGTMALAGAAGPPAGREIRTSRIVLTDPAGAVRGTLAVEADGTPALRLSDAAGVERLAAVVSGGGPAISLQGGDRKTAAKLLVEAGVPRLALSDATGTDRLWAAVRLGSPVVQFISSDGAPRCGIATMNDDRGLAVVTAASGPEPGLVLYNKDRKIVWSAP